MISRKLILLSAILILVSCMESNVCIRAKHQSERFMDFEGKRSDNPNRVKDFPRLNELPKYMCATIYAFPIFPLFNLGSGVRHEFVVLESCDSEENWKILLEFGKEGVTLKLDLEAKEKILKYNAKKCIAQKILVRRDEVIEAVDLFKDSDYDWKGKNCQFFVKHIIGPSAHRWATEQAKTSLAAKLVDSIRSYFSGNPQTFQKLNTFKSDDAIITLRDAYIWQKHGVDHPRIAHLIDLSIECMIYSDNMDMARIYLKEACDRKYMARIYLKEACDRKYMEAYYIYSKYIQQLAGLLLRLSLTYGTETHDMKTVMELFECAMSIPKNIEDRNNFEREYMQSLVAPLIEHILWKHSSHYVPGHTCYCRGEHRKLRKSWEEIFFGTSDQMFWIRHIEESTFGPGMILDFSSIDQEIMHRKGKHESRAASSASCNCVRGIRKAMNI